MNKIIKIFLIFILVFVMFSCSSEQVKGHYEEHKIKIINKETATESKYNWFFEKYEIYTAYYLVLENGEVLECDIEEYMKYQIGDNYTIQVWVEDKEVNNNVD